MPVEEMTSAQIRAYIDMINRTIANALDKKQELINELVARGELSDGIAPEN